jgi:hypothetical protein
MNSKVMKKLLHWEEYSLVDKIFLAIPRVPYMLVALLKPEKHMPKRRIKSSRYFHGLVILSVFALLVTSINSVSEIPYFKDIALRAIFLKSGGSFTPWLALNLLFLMIIVSIFYKKFDKSILFRAITYGLTILFFIHAIWFLMHSFGYYSYSVHYGVGPVKTRYSIELIPYSWRWGAIHIVLEYGYMLFIVCLIIIFPLKAARSKSREAGVSPECS